MLRSYYLILMAQLNRSLTSGSLQLRTNLRLTTPITINDVRARPLKVLQKQRQLPN